MINERVDEYRASASGDNSPFLWDTDLMQLFATSEHQSEALGNNAQTTAPFQPNRSTGSASSSKCVNEHIDPRVLCCNQCPDVCSNVCDVRPAKRRASPQKVSEYHSLMPELHAHMHTHTHTHASQGTDCQFPDDCFDTFCQDCNLDPTCSPECATPCSDDKCKEDLACFDPHCENSSPECLDGCVDPECTKLACPDQPCFCQKCHAQPCPLGDSNNECHFAHSAPMTMGTTYCYDTVPCHFQEGYHSRHDEPSSFETYSCFSQAHAFTGDNSMNKSTASVSALPSNNCEMPGTLDGTNATSISHPMAYLNCDMNISSAHCHIDRSCCHGVKRPCEDSPYDLSQLESWNHSMTPEDGPSQPCIEFDFTAPHAIHTSCAASNFMPYGLGQSATTYQNSLWLPGKTSSTSFAIAGVSTSRQDFYASSVERDSIRPATATSSASTSQFGTDSTTAKLCELQECTCKWLHDDQTVCDATFDSAEALHKHIKTCHVDNCKRCTCRWEGCEVSAKDFKQRSKLSRHLLGHAGHRPYACKFCYKTFATNQAKDNHERIHSGDRPYVCEHCSYATTTHTQLQTHISALHERKKPHKCRFCDFVCADSSNLTKHERTHQTLRPYRCPHPNCTFKPDCRWENLKRHLRKSEHYPLLLDETSREYKTYRENVRREIEQWTKRNGSGSENKTSRRKSRT